MGTGVSIPSIDVVGYCRNKDPKLFLVEVICRFPVTMDPDKNPFHKRPEDLSENTWYLLCSDQIGDSEAGFWMAKGEPRQMIFPDSPIICLEIIHVFRERNDQETDWMMLEYNVTNVINLFDLNSQAKLDILFGNLARSLESCPGHRNSAPTPIFLPGAGFLELLDLEVPLFPSAN